MFSLSPISSSEGRTMLLTGNLKNGECISYATMDEIRIIHTGDTHLGYRQYHSEVRRQDFLNAFAKVIDDAIAMRVDAVIHAGDLFDSRNPTLEDILETMRLFSRLKDAQIPLLAVVGNHESKQSTQWLDLYESMGLVIRLGTTPHMLGNVAVYGIDHVPKSRIPMFDYSVFTSDNNIADSTNGAASAEYRLLVMHQMMKPFAFGEWDVQEILSSLPFKVDAVLLGDNHKHEIIRLGETWVTYCGSTERNGISELEPRSYNIVTAGSEGIEISKRVIPTRDFVFIPVSLSKGSQAYEEIFSAIKERDVEGKVVFVNISGDPEIKVKFSEIEEFLLSRKALVPGIRDLRTGDISVEDPSLSFCFTDPDEAVKKELRGMHLTRGGLMLDEIIRDPLVVKSRVDTEVEDRLGELLEGMDFTDKVEIPKRPALQEDGSDEMPLAELTEEAAVVEKGKAGPASDDDTAATPLQVGEAPAEDKERAGEDEQLLPADETAGLKEPASAYWTQPASQQHLIPGGEDVRDHPVSDSTALKSARQQKARPEKGSEPSEDNKNKTASKPRQYNLGDYL
jgi:DNA repair exonuclease SbcCD nuclease subunit